LLGDSYREGATNAQYQYGKQCDIIDGGMGFYRNNGATYCVHLRHQDKGNILFFDGHVDSCSATELIVKCDRPVPYVYYVNRAGIRCLLYD